MEKKIKENTIITKSPHKYLNLLERAYKINDYFLPIIE